MATNNDNACYAVALYNAMEPFVAIHTQFVDRVHISSVYPGTHRPQPLSSDIGLKYILSISNFLNGDMFNSRQINLYIDLTELDKDDFDGMLFKTDANGQKQVIYDWIHFSSEGSDVHQEGDK